MGASEITIQTIEDGAATADSQDIRIVLRDRDARDLALRLPALQVARLVEICALALTTAARRGHDIDSKLLDSQGLFRIGFWRRIAGKDGHMILSLTLENGGVLAFEIPAPMARSMFSVGCDRPEWSTPETRGFGE